MKKAENIDVSQEQIDKAFLKYQNEAEEILKDENKLQKLIKKSKSQIRKLKKLPFIGAVIDDYIDLIDLLVSYAKGTYKNIPLSILIAIVTALLYVILPIDIISDAIPVAGYIDDALVITFACGIARIDLDKFRKYRLNEERKKLGGFINTMFNRDDVNNKFLQAIVLSSTGSVKALFSYENPEEVPVVCNMYVSNINLDDFSSPEILNDFVNAFKNMFFECIMPNKTSVSFQIYDEQSYSENETKYIITEKIIF